MNSGWIKLHRNITEHWIWQDPIKLKWWLDIIMFANHEDKKVNIGMQLVDCKRGQCVMSLLNWGKRWKVSKHTVHNFFTLLKKDGMITSENLTKTTRITVCNYDSYQDSLHATETTRERNGNAMETQRDTNKNDKNEKNKETTTNVVVKKSAHPDFVKFNSWLSKNAPYCANPKNFEKQITEENFFSLKEKYNGEQIAFIIGQIENRKDLRKKYTDLYRTVLNWAKKEYGNG